MRVLLIEDNESTRTLLEALLASRGHAVTACPDAESAIAAYQEDAFPLVLADWLLPGMDGLTFCRRLRQEPAARNTFILMVTARDRGEDLREVLEAGADDYLAKPIDIEALRIRLTVAERQVEHLQQRRRAEQRLADAYLQVQRSRDDLESILDKSEGGTAMIDPAGNLTFLSRTCRAMFGLGPAAGNGAPWAEALPLAREALEELRQRCAQPETQRRKLTVDLDLDGLARRVDIDVRDDPRYPQGRILFVYDVSALDELRRLLDGKARFHDLIGRGPAMTEVFEQVQRVANVDSTVLIEGETGTGKELVARAIHFAGHRREQAFVAVNCAGLTESLLASQLFGHKRGAFTGAVADSKGFFESADGGTLFLDEIGDIPSSVQISLLRVLQEREILRLGESSPRKVDVRILTATHHDLAEDVARGSFRADLLYRIRVARVQLPPLRERREDVPLLVHAFLEQLRAMRRDAPVETVSKDALRLLLEYDWPGNVRELRGCIEYAVIRARGAVIEATDLPPEICVVRPRPPVANLVEPVREASNETILRTLDDVKGNRSLAAQRLGMSRSTFYRRLADIGLVASTRR